MTQHRPPARLTATAVAVALVLTACGNAKGDPSAPEATSSSTSTTTTTSIPTTTTVAPTTTTTTAPVDVRALRPPAPAGDPAALAQQITAAETTIRDPLADPVAVATASLAHQVAYRQLGSHPEWDADVLAALPEGLRPSAALNAAARREFRGMHTKLSTALPAWQIVEPPPYEELMAVYAEASAAFGIPWEVLAAVNLVETGIGRIRGTSIAGAQGPMQFMPATWDAYGDGGDVNNTRDAIFGAARYLAANNGAVDIAHALYRYNHSERYVRGVQAYADLISEHPRAFLGYYHWGVWYLTEQGEVYLPIGYHETEPVPVADYLAR
jgi:hypothetical protein